MIKISNIKSVIADIDSKGKSTINKEKNKIVESILVDLKNNTPIDTGFARDSWRVNSNAIINDADYINALNQGSSTQAPKHFIEKTILSHKGVIPNGTIVVEK